MAFGESTQGPWVHMYNNNSNRLQVQEKGIRLVLAAGDSLLAFAKNLFFFIGCKMYWRYR